MQPELASEPFHRDGWVYEEKYDGWRLVAYRDGSRVRLVSRSGVDHTARFPEIAAAVAGLLAPQLVLDGEVCVFDDQLVSQFHLLGWSDADRATIQTHRLHGLGLPARAWARPTPAAAGRAPGRPGGRADGPGTSSTRPGASLITAWKHGRW